MCLLGLGWTIRQATPWSDERPESGFEIRVQRKIHVELWLAQRREIRKLYNNACKLNHVLLSR
jgi:hypothetical protein